MRRSTAILRPNQKHDIVKSVVPWSLGLLVAAHGRTVSTVRPVDGLWEDAPTGAVVLWQVEHAVDAAGGMGSEARESLLTMALAEWRGNAFEEFSSRPWTKTERAWIAELRAGAVE